MLIHQKVQAYLKNNEIRQTTVAVKAGIAIETFDAILNGTQTMYDDDLRAICYALRVVPELFVECEGENYDLTIV